MKGRKKGVMDRTIERRKEGETSFDQKLKENHSMLHRGDFSLIVSDNGIKRGP
jgi:hypothetical protein